MLLEAPRLAPLAVHASQLFGERPTASLTIKATTGKVQKRALAPNIQITHTAVLAIMVRHRNLMAARTDSYLFPMHTVQMDDFLFTAPLQPIAGHYELGQNALPT
jgi:hypothetical protein